MMQIQAGKSIGVRLVFLPDMPYYVSRGKQEKSGEKQHIDKDV